MNSKTNSSSFASDGAQLVNSTARPAVGASGSPPPAVASPPAAAPPTAAAVSAVGASGSPPPAVASPPAAAPPTAAAVSAAVSAVAAAGSPPPAVASPPAAAPPTAAAVSAAVSAVAAAGSPPPAVASPPAAAPPTAAAVSAAVSAVAAAGSPPPAVASSPAAAAVSAAAAAVAVAAAGSPPADLKHRKTFERVSGHGPNYTKKSPTSLHITDDHYQHLLHMVKCKNTRDRLEYTKRFPAEQAKLIRKHYQNMKRHAFHVVEPSSGEPYLAKRQVSTNPGDLAVGVDHRDLIVVSSSGIFDAIKEEHVGKASHLKLDATNDYVRKKYHGITRNDVELFIDSCEVCNTSSVVQKPHKGAAMPIQSESFRDRWQIDLIDKLSDVQTDHNGLEMKHILVVKDHFTRFTVARAIPNKTGAVIAAELEQIFSWLGYPLIYHTDNAGELCGALAQDLLKRVRDDNKGLEVFPVQGRSRTPRDQGSVERTNRELKSILSSLVKEKRRQGKPSATWLTELNGAVRALNSGVKCRRQGEVPPYSAVFAMEYYVNHGVPSSVLSGVSTEEELMEALPQGNALLRRLRSSQEAPEADHCNVGDDAPSEERVEESAEASDDARPGRVTVDHCENGQPIAHIGVVDGAVQNVSRSLRVPATAEFYHLNNESAAGDVDTPPFSISLGAILLELQGVEEWDGHWKAFIESQVSDRNKLVMPLKSLLQQHMTANHHVYSNDYLGVVLKLLQYKSGQSSGPSNDDAPQKRAASDERKRSATEPLTCPPPEKRARTDDDDELLCQICQEDLPIDDQATELSCHGTTFHLHCILNWSEHGGKTCPMCRNKLPEAYSPTPTTAKRPQALLPHRISHAPQPQRPTLSVMEALNNDAQGRSLPDLAAPNYDDEHQYDFVYPQLDCCHCVFPRRTDGIVLSLPGPEYIRDAGDTDEEIWWLSDVILSVLGLIAHDAHSQDTVFFASSWFQGVPETHDLPQGTKFIVTSANHSLHFVALVLDVNQKQVYCFDRLSQAGRYRLTSWLDHSNYIIHHFGLNEGRTRCVGVRDPEYPHNKPWEIFHPTPADISRLPPRYHVPLPEQVDSWNCGPISTTYCWKFLDPSILFPVIDQMRRIIMSKFQELIERYSSIIRVTVSREYLRRDRSEAVSTLQLETDGVELVNDPIARSRNNVGRLSDTRLASTAEANQETLNIVPGSGSATKSRAEGTIGPSEAAEILASLPETQPLQAGTTVTAECGRVGSTYASRSSPSRKKRQRVQANKMAKVRKDNLKRILESQQQHSSGNLPELKLRVADGELRGRLPKCPRCCKGRLKVCSSDPLYVYCPGTFDAQARQKKPCPHKYRVLSADESIQRTQWTADELHFSSLKPEEEMRRRRKSLIDLFITKRQASQAEHMKSTFVSESEVVVGKYVNIRLHPKQRTGAQTSVQGVVYYVHPTSGSCKVVTDFGIIKRQRADSPESYPTDMVTVLSDNATVSARLAVHRQTILTKEFKADHQVMIQITQIAKKTDDHQKGMSSKAP